MGAENDDQNRRSQEPESLDETSNPKDLQSRKELNNVPESGWEAGQGISNKQFIGGQNDEDQNGTQRGPSDAGIGMEEIRKKQKDGDWGSGSGA